MATVYMIALPLVGIFLGWTIRWLYARYQLSSSEQKSLRLKQDAVKEAEQEKKSILLDAQNQIMKERRQVERESRDRRNEVQKYERRVQQKEDNLDKKSAILEKKLSSISDIENSLEKREEAVAAEEIRWQAELEKISGLTTDEAKKLIIQSLENEAKHDAQASGQ